jgi:hypothetical protein
MNKAAVIIPAYLESLNQFEIASLIQCNSILNRYPKILICERDLNIDIYKKHVPEITFEFFNKEYFKTVDGYNRLLLSNEFYGRFKDFEYILIYQLDAWVFRDELDYWCQKGYDYIGSPWFENYGSYENGDKLWTIGNGGFSLRRVHSFLERFYYKKPLFKISGLKVIHPEKKTLIGKLFRIFNIYLIRFGMKNTINRYTQNFKCGEDTFWSVILLKSKKPLRIPECEEAIYFSFERSPGYLYELTGNRLPFGCHAWGKHNFNKFWNKFIQVGS